MSVKHTPGELIVIESFVRESRCQVTVDELGKFIHENLGQLWNTRDETTHKYLQSLIDYAFKRRNTNA
jgi:hypothetical protein